MMKIRRANERGHADHGWLKSYHTFSFADYYDPAYMGFRALRVINEDRVAAGRGFGTHGHRDMEIVSYVLEGELEHKDSMGNGEILQAGEFQRITAGTGILHSEFNPSAERGTHFYQIWLEPERAGIEPSYEQRRFEVAGRRNRFQLVASREGSEGSLRIHQDAKIFLGDVEPGERLEYTFGDQRYGWLQVLRGTVLIEGTEFGAGDACALDKPPELVLLGKARAEVMLFDLA